MRETNAARNARVYYPVACFDTPDIFVPNDSKLAHEHLGKLPKNTHPSKYGNPVGKHDTTAVFLSEPQHDAR
jgi:hypothetical protein